MKLEPISGLDLVIDGDLRTVKKLGDDRESTLVLVRGGAGCGKTIFASHLALYEAAKRDGDVIYCCLELLPTELKHQLGGIDFGPAPIEVVTGSDRPTTTEHPRVCASIVEPAIATELSRVLAAARAGGFVPRVLVVDSLAEGYDLGPKPPRALADGIAKLAAEEGIIVILVEETTSASTDSLWPFVADVVFELAHRGEANTAAAESRSLLCTKSRFGRTHLGPHEFGIESQLGIRVRPRASSYLHPRDASHGWRGARWVVLDNFPLEAEVVLLRDSSPALLRRLARAVGGATAHQLDLETIDESAEALLALARVALDGRDRRTTMSLGNLGAWRNSDELSRALPPLVDLAQQGGFAVLLYDSGANPVARSLAHTEVIRDGATWTVASARRQPMRLTLPTY